MRLNRRRERELAARLSEGYKPGVSGRFFQFPEGRSDGDRAYVFDHQA
jgi:hypothetical protein